MSAIDSAFSSEGPMKTKNIHVGNVFVYNNLSVEDTATFEGDVEFHGSVTSQKGIKIGNTLFTEDKLNAQASGVNGVVADASTAPASKKLKLETKSYTGVDGLNYGVTETNDMSDKANYVQAKGVVSQDQVFSHTGFATVDGKASTFITPNYVATSGLAVDNLYTRKYDPDVTEGGKTDEINVQAQTFRVRTLGAVGSGKITINDGLTINGQVGNLKVDSVTVDDGQGGGALTVKGDTNFEKNVTFNDSCAVTIPQLTVTKLTVQKDYSGPTANTTETKTDIISSLTPNGTIDINAPVENLSILLDKFDVMWDNTKNEFYLPINYNTGTEFQKYFGALSDADQTDIKTNFFNGKDPELVMGYLKMFRFMYCPEDVTGIFDNINPLREDEFKMHIILSTNSTDKDHCKYMMYKDYREGNYGREIINICEENCLYFIKFFDLFKYIFDNGLGVRGIETITKKDKTTEVEYSFAFKDTELVVPFNSFRISYIYEEKCIRYSWSKESTMINGTTKKGEYSIGSNLTILANFFEYLVTAAYVNIYLYDVTNRSEDSGIPYFIFKKYACFKPEYEKDNMELVLDHFNQLDQYMVALKNRGYVDSMILVLMGYVKQFANMNQALIFLDGLTTDQEKSKAEKLFYSASWYSLIKEVENTDLKVTAEYIRSTSCNTFQIQSKGVMWKTDYPIVNRMQISTNEGDLKVTGNTYTDNIYPNNSEIVQISSANFDTLYINNTQILPDPNNIQSEMKFNPKIIKLAKNKCHYDNANPVEKWGDERTNPHDTEPPRITVDYNYCGDVVFITIRPIIFTGKKMIDFYIPSSQAGRGVGRFDLPIAINPYGFKILHKNIKLDDTVGAPDTDRPLVIYDGTKAFTNSACYYEIGESPFSYIKYVKKGDGTAIPWVFSTGTVKFYTTPYQSKSINLDWHYTPVTDTKVPEGYTEDDTEKRFLVIEGLRFVSPIRSKENSNFYLDVKYPPNTNN